MSEENSSSLEVAYNLSLHVVKFKKRMIMVPFGYPFNFDFMEKASAGDIVCLGNGTLIKIVHKTTVNIGSSVAELLAWSLYGKPMKDVFQMFIDEFGADNIQNEEIIVMTYDIIE